MSDARAEVEQGRRFAFGENWRRFLGGLSPQAVAAAEKALHTLLDGASLSGRTFLDVGSGSGLSSLAARRLGARVTSFDFDLDSVACTRELRERFYPGDEGWSVAQGSVLDREFLRSLGAFEVVYSWGVLHHTGAMWDALKNTAAHVAPGGLLALALYNDQGLNSRLWRRVKRLFVSGIAGRIAVCAVAIPLLAAQQLAVDAKHLDNPLHRYLVAGDRGMSVYWDWLDWLGGYPFEVVRPGEVVSFLRPLGFQLERLETTTGLGCNEFLFSRSRTLGPV